MHPVVHCPSAIVWVSSLYGVDYVRLRQQDSATGQHGSDPHGHDALCQVQVPVGVSLRPRWAFLELLSEGAR